MPRDAKPDIEPLMSASRVITGAVVRSLAEGDRPLTLPQLRVLVLLSAHRQLNLSGLAAGMGVNASNASRTCDQLVTAGLVQRRENQQDRRHVDLVLTAAGKRTVRRLMSRREDLLREVLDRMSARSRSNLMAALTEFNRAAEELPVPDEGGSPGLALPWVT